MLQAFHHRHGHAPRVKHSSRAECWAKRFSDFDLGSNAAHLCSTCGISFFEGTATIAYQSRSSAMFCGMDETSHEHLQFSQSTRTRPKRHRPDWLEASDGSAFLIARIKPQLECCAPAPAEGRCNGVMTAATTVRHRHDQPGETLRLAPAALRPSTRSRWFEFRSSGLAAAHPQA
jgi:hypothetical protein